MVRLGVSRSGYATGYRNDEKLTYQHDNDDPEYIPTLSLVVDDFEL